MKERIATKDDPRRFGKPLFYDKHGLWRYRVQDVRIKGLPLLQKITNKNYVYSKSSGIIYAPFDF